MNETKQWYQSRTIWGAAIAIAASVAHAGGISLSASDQSQIVDGALSISGALGGLLAIYGRVAAKSKLA